MNLIQKIPTPKEYVSVDDFLKVYAEAFHLDTLISGGNCKLKDNYEFEGYHMLIAESKYYFMVDDEYLVCFRPILNSLKSDTKFYLNKYSKSTTRLLKHDMYEADFKGYHKQDTLKDGVIFSISDTELNIHKIDNDALKYGNMTVFI